MPPLVTPPLPRVPGTIALQQRNSPRIRCCQRVPRRLTAPHLPNRRTLHPKTCSPEVKLPLAFARWYRPYGDQLLRRISPDSRGEGLPLCQQLVWLLCGCRLHGLQLSSGSADERSVQLSSPPATTTSCFRKPYRCHGPVHDRTLTLAIIILHRQSRYPRFGKLLRPRVTLGPS